MCHQFTKTLLQRRGEDVDDPATTVARLEIVSRKAFLKRIYEEWYRQLLESLPEEDGPVVELGSGPGFLKRIAPEVIAADVIFHNHLDVVLDGRLLPFADGSLRAIVMTDVFHHISRPRDFLAAAARSVRLGGVVSMVEPWVTPWSRFIYGHLHPEPFTPDADSWEFPDTGPLSGANTALPWIIFQRDRKRFEFEFPCWRLQAVKLDMPLSYLLAGGLTPIQLMPGAAWPFWRMVEGRMTPWMDRLAMFAHITLERVDA